MECVGCSPVVPRKLDDDHPIRKLIPDKKCRLGCFLPHLAGFSRLPTVRLCRSRTARPFTVNARLQAKWNRRQEYAKQTTNWVTLTTEAFKSSHQYEFIDSKELASRWNLPESWVREQVRSRSADPLPHIRFGKYVRFRWGSPELEDWAERRIVSSSNRVVGRALGKEST